MSNDIDKKALARIIGAVIGAVVGIIVAVVFGFAKADTETQSKPLNTRTITEFMERDGDLSYTVNKGYGLTAFVRCVCAALVGGGVGWGLGNKAGKHLYRVRTKGHLPSVFAARQSEQPADSRHNEPEYCENPSPNVSESEAGNDAEIDPIGFSQYSGSLRVFKLGMLLGVWKLLKTESEAAWASLEKGMTRDSVDKLIVATPTVIRENDNVVVYQYSLKLGGGRLTFINGRLVYWSEPQFSELPPQELVDAIDSDPEEKV